jgi:hypothetical protein
MIYQLQGNPLWRAENEKRGFKYTPETHRLVATLPAGCVSITTPTHEALYFMTGHGGYWNGYPFGFLNELVRRKTCPILQKGHPCTKEAATRFVKAMQWGGRSCEEAWDIIGQHDCARFGTAIEIMHVDEIPKSREFRNFWRRSLNGGPIYVFDAPAREANNMRRVA